MDKDAIIVGLEQEIEDLEEYIRVLEEDFTLSRQATANARRSLDSVLFWSFFVAIATFIAGVFYAPV